MEIRLKNIILERFVSQLLINVLICISWPRLLESSYASALFRNIEVVCIQHLEKPPSSCLLPALPGFSSPASPAHRLRAIRQPRLQLLRGVDLGESAAQDSRLRSKL